MNQRVWIPSTWVKTNSVVSICNPSASMRGWKLRSHQAWHTHIKITPVTGKTNIVGWENIHWVWLSQKTEWRLSIFELWNSKARRILLMLIFEKCGLTKDLYNQGSNDQLQERHTFTWETLNMMNFNQSEQLFATCYLLSIVHCAMKDGRMTSSPRYTKQSLNVWGRMCMEVHCQNMANLGNSDPNKLLWTAMEISGLSDKLASDYTWDTVGGDSVCVFGSKHILPLCWTVWNPVLAHLS